MLDAISVYESGDGPGDTSLIDLALSRLAQIDDAVVLRESAGGGGVADTVPT
jgi:hypothetical protein